MSEFEQLVTAYGNAIFFQKGVAEARAALLAAAPAAPAQEPVAHVPVHPKTGPLWASAFGHDRLHDSDRPKHYALMPLYAAPAPAVAAQGDEIARLRQTIKDMGAAFNFAAQEVVPAQGDEQDDAAVDEIMRLAAGWLAAAVATALNPSETSDADARRKRAEDRERDKLRAYARAALAGRRK